MLIIHTGTGLSLSSAKSHLTSPNPSIHSSGETTFSLNSRLSSSVFTLSTFSLRMNPFGLLYILSKKGGDRDCRMIGNQLLLECRQIKFKLRGYLPHPQWPLCKYFTKDLMENAQKPLLQFGFCFVFSFSLVVLNRFLHCQSFPVEVITPISENVFR